MSYTRLAMETDMSLHNQPLTDLEKTGLIKHGLPTDKHSQLSDAFRLGMAWALKEERKAAKCKDDGDAMARAMA